MSARTRGGDLGSACADVKHHLDGRVVRSCDVDVIGMRRGHPFAKDPTLDRFCRMRHVVVSLTGEAHGFVDDALARLGRSRRVALSVPSFMLALSVVAETDLLAALPKAFVDTYARRFDGVGAKPPLPLDRSPIRAIASKAALMDEGVAWIFARVGDETRFLQAQRTRRRRGDVVKAATPIARVGEA